MWLPFVYLVCSAYEVDTSHLLSRELKRRWNLYIYIGDVLVEFIFLIIRAS